MSVAVAARSHDTVAATVAALPFAPPLAERQRAILDTFGDDARDPALPSFRSVLVREVDRLFDDVVLPLVRPVWPNVDSSPFLAKWKSGYVLYCGLGLSTIVCSRRRPRTVNASSAVVRALGFSEHGVTNVARVTIPIVFRVLERALCERAAIGAAWILVLDEALDDGMPGLSLSERGATLRRALRGEVSDDASVELRASAALSVALAQRCTGDDDVTAFDGVIDAVSAWVDGELASVRGDIDPTGTSFRMAGVTGSMDVLLWAVRAYAGDVERDFLYRIAELGQVVDDWLDLDKDRAQGRTTPAVTGVWGLDDVTRTYAQASALLEALAEQAGEPEGPFRALLRRTFRGEVQRMARVLVDNP